jgi:hypothetical protein
MKKIIPLTLTAILMLCGCAGPKAIAADDFELFYSGTKNVVSTAELESRRGQGLEEFRASIKSDYESYAKRLDEIIAKLMDLSEQSGPEESKSLTAAARILISLSDEFKSERKIMDSTVCSLTMTNLKEALICTEQQWRWVGDISRAIKCSFYFSSIELREIPVFDIKRVWIFGEHSDKELSSCNFFLNSKSLYGYPKRIIVTKIPDRFQSRFYDLDNDFPVEIADGLYTESTTDLITDSLYGSWHGKCAVFRRYERLLLENDFLLGSFKEGTCS